MVEPQVGVVDEMGDETRALESLRSTAVAGALFNLG